MVDEGVGLLGAGSRNICVVLYRVTAPFPCGVDGVVSSPLISQR